MEKRNYQASITVSNPPQEVFNSVNNVSAWWSADFEGRSTNVNDEFTVQFGETWMTHKVLELVSDQRIVWLVTDCHKHWLLDKKEWKNTRIVWEIAESHAGTELKLTHEGLVPELECYSGCEKGWNFYLKESIFKLLTEGKGRPALPATKETLA